MNLRYALFILAITFCSVVSLHGQFDKIENLKEDDSKRIRFGYFLGLNAIGAKVDYLQKKITHLFAFRLSQSQALMWGF